MRLTEAAALDFFAMFGRFEFSMISAGFVRAGRNDSAEPDWNGLIACREQCDEADIQPLLDAGAQLAAAPPKRLVLVNGVPDYVEAIRGGQSNVRFLVEAVKRARNNLFHGGKYRTARFPVARNAFVVGESIQVLQALLDLPRLHRVRAAYENLPP
ncbi:MAG TPA: hypothetical protein VFT23_01960 [Burkholderiales bacterium]|nr:hypothetical protein [Burkholderiales bacterium]